MQVKAGATMVISLAMRGLRSAEDPVSRHLFPDWKTWRGEVTEAEETATSPWRQSGGKGKHAKGTQETK